MKDLMFYIDEYEKNGIIRDEANRTGNYKVNNMAYKKMEKIFKIAIESSQKEEFFLAILNTSKSPSTLITCCAHMMKLNIHMDLARKKLEEIAYKKGEKSIFSFNAKMFLQEWDAGNIKQIQNVTEVKKEDNIDESTFELLEYLLCEKDDTVKHFTDLYNLSEELVWILDHALSMYTHSLIVTIEGSSSLGDLFEFKIIDRRTGIDVVEKNDGGLHEKFGEIDSYSAEDS